MSFRLVHYIGTGIEYVTGAVRSVRTDDGCDFVAELTGDGQLAALYPTFHDALDFRLRLALDGFKIEPVEAPNASCGTQVSL